MLRRVGVLRSHLVWILAVLLLAGAASYSQGSRYAIVGHGYSQSAGAEQGAQTAAETVGQATAQAAQAVGQAVGQATGQAAGPSANQPSDRESVEDGCCERRQAPRSEPVPLRTGAVEPPSLLHSHPGPAVLSGILPAEPDLPPLTVVQLSISRT